MSDLTFMERVRVWAATGMSAHIPASKLQILVAYHAAAEAMHDKAELQYARADRLLADARRHHRVAVLYFLAGSAVLVLSVLVVLWGAV